MRIIKALFCLIAILVVVNVTVTNRSLDQSLTMKQLDQEIEILEKDNNILNSQNAELGSLATLEPKIEAAGFIAPSQVLAVGDSSMAVASR